MSRQAVRHQISELMRERIGSAHGAADADGADAGWSGGGSSGGGVDADDDSVASRVLTAILAVIKRNTAASENDADS